MKQTSIDWLKKELEQFGSSSHLDLDWDTFDELIKQAKEMHKQEIIDAFGIGCHHESKRLVGYQHVAEQYYNETYGK